MPGTADGHGVGHGILQSVAESATRTDFEQVEDGSVLPQDHAPVADPRPEARLSCPQRLYAGGVCGGGWAGRGRLRWSL